MASISHLQIKPPPPEETSLKYILSAKFPKGMPEKLIAIALKEILFRLELVHENIGVHSHIGSAMIGIDWDDQIPSFSRIELCHDEDLFLIHLGHPDPKGLEFDFQCLGIVAMEMAYGSLSDEFDHLRLNATVNNLVRILRPKLQLAGRGSTIKRMPDDLDLFLDDKFVDHREQNLRTKANANYWQKTGFLWGDFKKSVRKFSHPDGKRKFSRGFLEVVMKLLDRDPPAPVGQILELPFMESSKDMAYFYKRVRKMKAKR